MAAALNTEKVAELFSLPSGEAYLNAAYMGPLLKEATAIGHKAVLRQASPTSLKNPASFHDEVEEVRSLFGQLIGTSGENIAIVPATSYGTATAARQLAPHLRSGDSIIVIEEQFFSNYFVWHRLAKECSAQLCPVSRPVDFDWTHALLQMIDTRADTCRLVAVPNVHWTDGSTIDLERIGKRCREKGAFLVVDGTQSIGARPLQLAHVQPDFLVCSAYKWLLCPYGLAFLYVAPQWQNGEPLELHNWSREPSSEFYSFTFRAGARRFDCGQRSSFLSLPMAAVAIGQILSWGVSSVEATIAPLVERCAERAVGCGLLVPPKLNRAKHMLGARLPRGWSIDLKELHARLVAEKCHVSIRGNSIRISPHVYNTREHVDLLFDTIAAFLQAHQIQAKM